MVGILLVLTAIQQKHYQDCRADHVDCMDEVRRLRSEVDEHVGYARRFQHSLVTYFSQPAQNRNAKQELVAALKDES